MTDMWSDMRCFFLLKKVKYIPKYIFRMLRFVKFM